MKCITPILLLLSALCTAQHTITVSVENVKNSNGAIRAALYDSSDSFLKFDAVFASTASKATPTTTVLVFKDIPSGAYGIALFHDENDNGEMDTNWMGIPKEKVAFSKARMKAFGPPDFEECKFAVQKDINLVIEL
ncbi:Hypothetical protein I595_1686 [Croceitalea dokdonensis DOKDO 023]|uniref:DUF2141 domain-containing protein n=1 Tax=Croceitalea dokdonensis DOKDO 023 TaxID=1300341 RepID=A0A0P7AVQ1_9FLAO|nr:DUF2141 domain-containing protein [Croceitalea dokdonensis]KPM32038.1 Hypothetical protein I595_1686 [Croceitalea dokdonensis DOKDO 023]